MVDLLIDVLIQNVPTLVWKHTHLILVSL